MATLAAIGIVTRDMAESVRFYRTLGLDVPDANDEHLELRLPSGLRLMWDTVDVVRSFDPEWQEPSGQGMTLAFECASPAEVDEVHARAVEAGFRSKKEPWDAFWGQRYAQVYDPDGYSVDLFAPSSPFDPSRRRITVPPPGARSATTAPPWRSATWRTIASPRPEPGRPRAEGAR